MAFDEEGVPITPVNFFQLSLVCSHVNPGSLGTLSQKQLKKYELPDTSALCGEDHFAECYLGWNEEGIELVFSVEKDPEKSFYPEIIKGDSVEVFIDTRDVKTSGYNTRFCHHFFFLPEPVDGNLMGEKTHFRTEDAHPFCDPDDLRMDISKKTGFYQMRIVIPKSCLFGYDPEQFDRIGFTYRVNRPKWQSQHFSAITDDFQIEQQPSLWASVRLVR